MKLSLGVVRNECKNAVEALADFFDGGGVGRFGSLGHNLYFTGFWLVRPREAGGLRRSAGCEIVRMIMDWVW